MGVLYLFYIVLYQITTTLSLPAHQTFNKPPEILPPPHSLSDVQNVRMSVSIEPGTGPSMTPCLTTITVSPVLSLEAIASPIPPPPFTSEITLPLIEDLSPVVSIKSSGVPSWSDTSSKRSYNFNPVEAMSALPVVSSIRSSGCLTFSDAPTITRIGAKSSMEPTVRAPALNSFIENSVPYTGPHAGDVVPNGPLLNGPTNNPIIPNENIQIAQVSTPPCYETHNSQPLTHNPVHDFQIAPRKSNVPKPQFSEVNNLFVDETNQFNTEWSRQSIYNSHNFVTNTVPNPTVGSVSTSTNYIPSTVNINDQNISPFHAFPIQDAINEKHSLRVNNKINPSEKLTSVAFSTSNNIIPPVITSTATEVCKSDPTTSFLSTKQLLSQNPLSLSVAPIDNPSKTKLKPNVRTSLEETSVPNDNISNNQPRNGIITVEKTEPISTSLLKNLQSPSTTKSILIQSNNCNNPSVNTIPYIEHDLRKHQNVSPNNIDNLAPKRQNIPSISPNVAPSTMQTGSVSSSLSITSTPNTNILSSNYITFDPSNLDVPMSIDLLPKMSIESEDILTNFPPSVTIRNSHQFTRNKQLLSSILPPFDLSPPLIKSPTFLPKPALRNLTNRMSPYSTLSNLLSLPEKLTTSVDSLNSSLPSPTINSIVINIIPYVEENNSEIIIIL